MAGSGVWKKPPPMVVLQVADQLFVGLVGIENCHFVVGGPIENVEFDEPIIEDFDGIVGKYVFEQTILHVVEGNVARGAFKTDTDDHGLACASDINHLHFVLVDGEKIGHTHFELKGFACQLVFALLVDESLPEFAGIVVCGVDSVEGFWQVALRFF